MIEITIRYSCTACAVTDAQLKVPARESPAVDLMQWLEATSYHIARDHRQRSPSCTATHMKDLMIPIDNVEWVGGPSMQ